MGRPALSTEVHDLHGTRPHAPKHEHAFTAGRPKLPSHLSKAARAEFKRAVQILERRGTLTEGEVTLLTLYSEIYARWIQAKHEIATDLMITTTVLDSNGKAHTQTKLNPLLKVAADCENRLLAIAKSLGLTPVDRNRSKLTAANDKEEIIPGSIADVMPWLLDPDKVVPINQPLSVDPNLMEAGGEETTDGAETKS
jgi:P27 family predicted phage terminase small subunit